MKSSIAQHLFEIWMFCNIRSVFTVNWIHPFWMKVLISLRKSIEILLSPYFWTVLYIYTWESGLSVRAVGHKQCPYLSLTFRSNGSRWRVLDRVGACFPRADRTHSLWHKFDKTDNSKQNSTVKQSWDRRKLASAQLPVNTSHIDKQPSAHQRKENQA